MMKIPALIGFLLLCWCAPAFAQVPDPQQKRPATEPLYIALVFYKLARQVPPFEAWAEQSREYRDAGVMDREDVLKKKTEELQKTFELISPFEPIILHTNVKLTPYNRSVHAFAIESYDEDSIFPVRYLGEHFGIIPEGLIHLRWVSVPEDAAEDIWRLTKEGKKARVELSLRPVSSLDEEPSEHQGIRYWPLRTSAEHVRVWSADGKKLLAENTSLQNKVKGFFRGGWK